MSKKRNRHQAVLDWALSHHMIPEQLDDMANVLRSTYIGLRQTAYPDYHMNTEKHNITFWREVATRVMERQYDPVTYVRAGFNSFGVRMHPVMLMSTRMDEAYDRIYHDPELEHKLELRVINAVKKLQLRYSEGTYTLPVLLEDKTVVNCPLFAWCVAKKYSVQALVDKYQNDAKRMLMDPTYKKVYSKAFPKEVSECQ